MEIKIGSRVVCIDAFDYIEYRATVVEMIERRGCLCATVLVDDSNELITEMIGCLIAEEQYDSGEF